eukprot:997796-Rhodomonas_salina.6
MDRSTGALSSLRKRSCWKMSDSSADSCVSDTLPPPTPISVPENVSGHQCPKMYPDISVPETVPEYRKWIPKTLSQCPKPYPKQQIDPEHPPQTQFSYPKPYPLNPCLSTTHRTRIPHIVLPS